MSSEFDVFDDADPVTADSEDSVGSEFDQDHEVLPTAGGDTTGAQPESPSTDSPATIDEERSEEPEFDGPIPVIRPRTHEIGANLLFADDRHGLSPYWGIVSEYEPDLEEIVDVFGYDGTAWKVEPDKTRYWTGGIAAEGQDYEAFNEYQVKIVADDALEKREATFQLRPSLPDAKTPDGDRIQSLPADLPQGIRVQVHSVNISREDLIPLLQRLAAEMGVNPIYFDTNLVHEWSRIYNFAMYVRYDRDVSQERVVNRGGLLDQLADFGRQSGGAGEYTWDNQKVQGYRSAVTLDASSWGKLLDDQHVGKRAKSYHPNFVRSESTSPDDDPLRDPKLELQTSSEYTDESIPWSSDTEFDAEDLEQVIDEALVNILHWAGIPLREDSGVYTPDEYFEAEETERDVDVHENPLEDIRDAEEQIAVREFASGNATESRKRVVQALTDGGDEQHVAELAEATDTSRSTVYRTVDTFADVLDVVDGHVSFQDGVIRDKFEELMGTFDDAARWVKGKVRDLAAGEDSLLTADSALAKWARQHSIDLTETRDGLLVDHRGRPITEYGLRKMLREGYQAARQDGLQAAIAFVEDSSFSWRSPDGQKQADKIVRRANTDVKICGVRVEPLR